MKIGAKHICRGPEGTQSYIIFEMNLSLHPGLFSRIRSLLIGKDLSQQSAKMENVALFFKCPTFNKRSRHTKNQRNTSHLKEQNKSSETVTEGSTHIVLTK